ncbi:hypothetical protein OOU_Y34scaffold00926g17 [Pyricularia oryzae Y34]|uniref:Uncharacterized protein n=2 Tax=Pyricularia oryzae TaxID=318829 RepID=A0AA97PGC1_PYRO3|nr:hypothetical protein OOU_Y34scaffold00926g17 [Pyricularia oryzae Y34]
MLDRCGPYRARRGQALSAYTTVDHRRIIVPHHELVNQQHGLEEVVLRPLNPVGSIYEVEAVMEMTRDFNLAQALSLPHELLARWFANMPNIHIFTLTLEAGETEQIRSKGWCNWLGSCHSTRISAAGGIPCLRNPQFSGQRQLFAATSPSGPGIIRRYMINTTSA